MTTATMTGRTGGSMNGVQRLVRRLEHERRVWSRGQVELLATERAWRAGVAEGLRLAQVAIRKGV